MANISLPLLGFIIAAGGWISREIQRRRHDKGQAASDAGKILSDKKALLEEMISKTKDTDSKQALNEQLGEVIAALLGLYAKRLRHVLDEAELPPEEVLIADGRSQLQPQQASRLEEIVEELITLPSPLSANVLRVLGNAYYYVDRYCDAIHIFDQLLALNADDATILFNRGTAYAQLEKYKETLTDFNRYLDLKPNNPAALVNRGGVYEHLKRYEEALADFDCSLKIKPDNVPALASRGAVYVDLERYSEALVDLNRALELVPDGYVALVNRGILRSKLGKYNEALIDFNHLLKLGPDDPAVFYDLACLFSLWGKTEDALVYLKRAIDKDKKYRETAKTDEDFDNIRDDPRFKKLIEPD